MVRKAAARRDGPSSSSASSPSLYGKCISIAFFVVGLQLTVILFLVFGSGGSSSGGGGGGHSAPHRPGALGGGPHMRGRQQQLPQQQQQRQQQQGAAAAGRAQLLPGGGGGGGGGGDSDRDRAEHSWKFQQPTTRLGITQLCQRRPYVIGGFTGSGTRLPMRILQHVGVHMGPDALISDDGDTLAWIRAMARHSIHGQINGVLAETGSPVYSLDDVTDSELKRQIDTEFQNFQDFWENELADHFLSSDTGTPDAHDVEALCSRKLRQFSWGWKGPRQMWFLPFIEKYFPNFHFVYAVRDVRDLLNDHTSFTEHDGYWVDSFFKGQAKTAPRAGWMDTFTHVGVAQLWAEASLAVLRWCQEPAQASVGRCTIVAPQTLGGDPKALPKFLSDLGLVEHEAPDSELWTDLRKNVLGACLGSSSTKSSQHKCDQSNAKFSANYRAWGKDQFYPGGRSGRQCKDYSTLMGVPHVKEALAALGFDADFMPAACTA